MATKVTPLPNQAEDKSLPQVNDNIPSQLPPPSVIQEIQLDDSEKPVEETNTFNTQCKRRVKKFLDNPIVVQIMTVVVIYALFGDDVRQITVEPDDDMYYYTATSICLGLFSIEILLTCYCEKGYTWSFFFWLDVVSTASQVFDIGWLSNIILQTEDNEQATSTGQLARAARTSRIGTKAAKITRIIRLIRLIRIVKLYKAAQKHDPEKEKKKKLRKEAEEKAKLEKEDMEERERCEKLGIDPSSVEKEEDIYFEKHVQPLFMRGKDNGEEQDPYQETNVGRILEARTTKRVILLVLSIMCCIPVYATSTYFPAYTSYKSGVDTLVWLVNNDPVIIAPETAYNYYTPYTTAQPAYITLHSDYTQLASHLHYTALSDITIPLLT